MEKTGEKPGGMTRVATLLGWSRFASIRRRLILSSTLWVLLAILIAGVGLRTVFESYARGEFDRRLQWHLDAMIGASEVESDGSVRFVRPLSDQRFEEPYSGLYWQVSTEGLPHFRSRSLWDQALKVQHRKASQKPSIYETSGPDGQRLRVMERDIYLPGEPRLYHFLVADDVGDMQSDVKSFTGLISLWLGVMAAGLLGTLFLQITFGIRPLQRIRAGIARVRGGQTARLETDYPPEVMPLVTELNALLDHNEAVIERARTHAGNLAHALKTPLSILRNEAEAGDGKQLAHAVVTQVEAMQQHVDYHLRRARAAGARHMATAQLSTAIAEIAAAMRKLYKDKALGFRMDIPEDLVFAGERQDILEILGNIVDNACKWAASAVSISAARRSSAGGGEIVEVVVDDDGPGVDEDMRAALFERGRRLDERVPGSGLGLAIAREIAELNDGAIALGRSALGGLSVRLTLPAAPAAGTGS